MSQLPPNQPNPQQPQPAPPMAESPGTPNPYATPTQQAYQQPMHHQEGDATGGVIPYKNPKALIAYYVSIASLLMWPLGVVALILGVLGLRARNANPIIKGSAHAWIGIVLGTLTTLAFLALVVVIIIGIANS